MLLVALQRTALPWHRWHWLGLLDAESKEGGHHLERETRLASLGLDEADWPQPWRRGKVELRLGGDDQIIMRYLRRAAAIFLLDDDVLIVGMNLARPCTKLTCIRS